MKSIHKLVGAAALIAATAAFAQESAQPDGATEIEASSTEPATATEGPPATEGAAATVDAPPPAETTAAPASATETIPVAAVSEEKADLEVREARPNATRLDDVVVTATKREASVRKIPATINALTGEDLEDMGAREMSDYLKLIPGITLQEGDTNNSRTISIRGIGPQPGANTTTGVLIEDVSTGDPYGSYLVPDLDPFDLKNLEVLKGPQGTLFGAAALNGAIRYVLTKPELDVWEAKGFAAYSEITQGDTGMTYGAAVNIPVFDSLALRAAGVKQDIPGLYDDINRNGKHDIDADDGRKTMYRVLGRWQITDDLTLNGFHLMQDGERDDLGIADNFDGEFVRTNTPGPSTSRQKFEVSNLDLRYAMDWATAVAQVSRTTKLQRVFYDGSAVVNPLAVAGIETLRLHNLADIETLGYELRLVSPDNDSPWVWLFGAYMSDYSVDASLNTPVANTEFLYDLLQVIGRVPIPNNPVNNLVPTPDGLSIIYIKFQPIEANEKSLFGELTRKFFDNTLALTVGGRYYTEDLDAVVITDGATAAYGDLLDYSGNKSMSAKGFNPKFTATWQWTPETLFYANASRGFQFGGLNAPAPLPTDNVYELSYRPSTIWSYEAGVRTDWFEKTLQLDLTAFFIDWTDMQLRQDTPSGNTDYIANVGQARSKGLEGALRWLTPVPGLMLMNAASYIRAFVQEPYTTESGDEIPKGRDLPAAPRVQNSTTLSYNLYLGGMSGGASLSYTYMGKAYSNVQHDAEIFDFKTLDGTLKFSAPGWIFSPEIAFNVTNILDERAYLGKRTTNLQGVPLAELATYNKPRAYGLRITGRF